MDSCFDLVRSLQHGVASCEVFSWSTDIHKPTIYMQITMTSDETHDPTINIVCWTTPPFRNSQGSTNSQSCDVNFAHVVYRENGLDAGKSTSTRIFTTRGYIWPMKTQDPYYLVP